MLERHNLLKKDARLYHKRLRKHQRRGLQTRFFAKIWHLETPIKDHSQQAFSSLSLNDLNNYFSNK